MEIDLLAKRGIGTGILRGAGRETVMKNIVRLLKTGFIHGRKRMKS